MLVETYEVNETLADGSVEEMSCEESLALIEQLGLRGQKQLLRRLPVGDGDTVTRRCPFRRIIAEERAVFRALCPEQTELKDYSSGPIPLRVLQVAAMAQPYFKNVVVWHPTDARADDPVLIGIMEVPNGFDWPDTAEFILARWGESLPSLSELRETIRASLVTRMNAKLETARATLDHFAATMPSLVERHLAGDSIALPYVDLTF